MYIKFLKTKYYDNNGMFRKKLRLQSFAVSVTESKIYKINKFRDMNMCDTVFLEALILDP